MEFSRPFGSIEFSIQIFCLVEVNLSPKYHIENNLETA